MHVDGMVRLLTLTEGRLLRAWLGMVQHLRDTNTVTAISGRLHTYDVLHGLEATIGKFTAEEHGAFVTAGQTAAKWLNGEFRKVQKKIAVLDPLDPHSVRWAQSNSLAKLREISDEQRNTIREILTAGARSGDNPLVMAREIRDSIGLTQYQARVVENYRRQLESRQFGGALQRELTDGRFDRTVTAAMRAERGLTAAQIDTMVERYRANWVAFRAETIARTEALRVAHQGTEELYRQAIVNGDIEASQIERTWNHSPRKGAKGGKKGKGKGRGGPREFHVSMHGQTRGYNEPFVSGLGAELRFPGDPEASAEETANCRCALSTRLLAGSAAASRGGVPQMPSMAEDVVDVGAEDMAAAATEEIPYVEDPYASYEVDLGEPVEPLSEFPEPSPEALSYEQQARQRLAEREAAHAAATADLEAAQREVEGFRIGVGAIGDETAIAEAEPLSPTPTPPSSVTAPDQLAGDPYRTPGHRAPDTAPIPSDKPAPLGYEAYEFNGETYYRHAVRGGPYYTRSELLAHTRGEVVAVAGPNEVFAGFDTVATADGSVVYRPQQTADSVYHTYTRDQVVSGEAAADEQWLRDAAARAAQKPGLLARARRLFGG